MCAARRAQPLACARGPLEPARQLRTRRRAPRTLTPLLARRSGPGSSCPAGCPVEDRRPASGLPRSRAGAPSPAENVLLSDELRERLRRIRSASGATSGSRCSGCDEKRSLIAGEVCRRTQWHRTQEDFSEPILPGKGASDYERTSARRAAPHCRRPPRSRPIRTSCCSRRSTRRRALAQVRHRGGRPRNG